MILEFIEGLKREHLKLGRKMTKVVLPKDMYERLRTEIQELDEYTHPKPGPGSTVFEVLGVEIALAKNDCLSVSYREG